MKKGYSEITITFFVWRHTDSNRGPSACKADALNQLSYASVLVKWMAKVIPRFYFTKFILNFFFKIS